MKLVKHLIKNKKDFGKVVEVEIMEPETIEEARKVMSEERIWAAIVKEYRFGAKRRALSKRSSILKLRVNELTVDQQAILRKLGLLKK